MHSAWGVISRSSIHAVSTHHCTSLNSRLHGADYQISPRKIGRIITYIFRHIISLNSSSEFAPINAKSMPTPIIDIADMCCRTEEKTRKVILQHMPLKFALYAIFPFTTYRFCFLRVLILPPGNAGFLRAIV